MPLSASEVPTHGIKVKGKTALTSNAKVVGSFGACSIKQGMPCTMVLSNWLQTSKVSVGGSAKLLTESSYCMCTAGGGKVSISPLSRTTIAGINVDDSASTVA